MNVSDVDPKLRIEIVFSCPTSDLGAALGALRKGLFVPNAREKLRELGSVPIQLSPTSVVSA